MQGIGCLARGTPQQVGVLCIRSSTESERLTVTRNARDQNAGIKTKKHLEEPLSPLLNGDGERSQLFPASVRELLELNGNLPFLSYLWMSDLVLP